MIRRWLWTAGWCAAIAAAAATRTAAAEEPKPLGPPAAVRDADALAAWIDEQFAADWRANRITPAAAADDAEFLRRVYPRPGRPHPVGRRGPQLPRRQKRPTSAACSWTTCSQRPRYVTHFTNVWRALPAAGSRRQRPGPHPHARLRGVAAQGADPKRRLRPDGPRPADRPDPAGRRPHHLRRRRRRRRQPSAYYLAKELKPENLGGATARLFLGVKLECAQCHNHPFAEWKREQFWELRRLLRRHPARSGRGTSSGRRRRHRPSTN